jgi:hypothetical protein
VIAGVGGPVHARDSWHAIRSASERTHRAPFHSLRARLVA